MSQIDSLFQRLRAGDTAATDELFPLVYDELRRVAQRRMATEPSGHTLDATALVNEVYLRLTGGAETAEWSSRAHFFSAAAIAMRRILVERARRYRTKKRGVQRIDIALDGLSQPGTDGADGILRLETALERLEVADPQASRIVSLRYFAGLSVEDTARALDISAATVKRGWAFARSWLFREVDRIREE